MKNITNTIAALALGLGCLASHAQPITETVQRSVTEEIILFSVHDRYAVYVRRRDVVSVTEDLDRCSSA